MNLKHRISVLKSTAHRMSRHIHAAVFALTLVLAGASEAETDETVVRKIYFPASALSYNPGGVITAVEHGLNVPATPFSEAKLVMPRPADAALADPSEPIKVTLYFAVPSAPVPGDYRWQLRATSYLVDSYYGATGWDSMSSAANLQNGVLTTYPASGSSSNLLKSQTWAASWSPPPYATWYFGSGDNSNNDFTNMPIWRFGFVRGKAVNNGETNTGNLIIVGVEISYLAYR